MRTTSRQAFTITSCLLFLLIGSSVCVAEMGPPISDEKKIIGFAGIVMSPAYLRERIVDVERMPFDGLVFTVYGNDWKYRKTGQEHLFFGGHRYQPGDFSNDLADLKATKFTRFTDNFIHIQTSARGSATTGNPKDGNLDWFDPAWDGIVQNGALVAKLAKDAGFKGFFLDVEDCPGSLGPWEGKHIFNYEVYPYKNKHTREAFCAQMQLRGRQYMQAVVEAYPDITIVMLQNTGWGKEDQLGFFVRGMLEARGNATIIDGLERGYEKVTRKELVGLRRMAESGQPKEKLFEAIQYAFGLWVDPHPNRYGGWHTEDPAEFYSPNEWENALYGALTETDKYVWMFTVHGAVWYTPFVRPIPMANNCQLCEHPKVPDAYVQAIINARNPHDLDWSPKIGAERWFYIDEAVLVEGDKITGDQPNLLENPGFEQWTDAPNSPPVAWDLNGHDPLIRSEDTHVKGGKHSVALSVGGIQGHTMVQKSIPAEDYAGKTITLGAWMRSTAESETCVQILDFVRGSHTTSTGAVEGDGKWHYITTTKTIRPDATGLIVLRLSQWMPLLKDTD
jgi:hypothetical protein